MIQTLPLTRVQVSSRQRKVIAPDKLRELKTSITERGLLHAPGVYRDENDVVHLVWGERRFRAIEALAAAGVAIRYDGQDVPLGDLPYVLFNSVLINEELQIELKTTELEENTIREDIPWSDRVKALAEIHLLRKAVNPTQTVIDTAREISARTGENVDTLRRGANSGKLSIPLALMVAPHLDDPDVMKAANPGAAFAIVTKKLEQQASAALIRKRQASRSTATVAAVRLFHGKMEDLFKLHAPDGTVDLILTDPPYGVNADDEGFNRRQAQTHSYDDDPAKARELMATMFELAWNAAKPRANLFMFLDSKHWEFAVKLASRMMWTPFPSPIIWDKESPGLGPWNVEGFQYQYEMILFATKGRKGLVKTSSNILAHKRVARTLRRHAAEKPLSLLANLIELSTLPGDLVVDPFAGSGSTLRAAQTLHRRAVGFEADRKTYDIALDYIFGDQSHDSGQSAAVQPDTEDRGLVFSDYEDADDGAEDPV